jgi:hypothetical protein
MILRNFFVDVSHHKAHNVQMSGKSRGLPHTVLAYFMNNIPYTNEVLLTSISKVLLEPVFSHSLDFTVLDLEDRPGTCLQQAGERIAVCFQ